MQIDVLATKSDIDYNTMTWQEALDITIRKTGHERYRVLCSESWPDYLAYRKLMIKLANEDLSRPMYPSVATMAKNVAIAASAAVASVVRGEAVSVSEEEQDHRLDICHGCEFWDSSQKRCSKCGCFGQWKTWLASQKCPIGKW